MNKFKALKKQLGDRYSYKKYMTNHEVLWLQKQKSKLIGESIVASLTVGFLRLDAVLYCASDKIILAYDVFAKDNIDSKDWICYDNLTDNVDLNSGLNEHEMFRMLDNLTKERDLSYIECNFKVVSGKAPRKKDVRT